MLPIVKYRQEIVDAVCSHSFTIVTAETGSGKSTQIPKYLSEIFEQVIVTEPRIMAAKTLARRVSEEMDVTLGQEVGYMTSYDKCYSPESKILYCTDGLQLIRTIFSSNTQSENVLIIDEAHEWNLNIETLIAWCKFMKDKWNTKVVVMSATMDAEALSKFFGEDVAVLSIPGSLYEVEVKERPQYTLISTISEKIAEHKNILVFVAGKKEISNVLQDLSSEDATVLPLHGEMDWNDQKKCFESYNNPKVIIATNVAQTSLTIPDIDVVIDTGEARISISENGIQGLFLKDISKADIFQRKGRAGRTKNGEYVLCSDTYIEWRDEYTVPEIQRSILDRVVLQLASFGLDAEQLEFYHQPEIEAIRNAKKELERLGALDSDHNVTELGYKMVKIPVSVQLARMIVEAEKYGVTEQVMTIAAIVEMGGLLSKDSSYSHFSTEENSDLLAELDVWNYLNRIGYIKFKELGIKKKAFFKIKEHIQKLREVLYGIVEMNCADDREAIVKSCLSGLISHIYINNGYKSFIGEDGIVRILDKNSCINCFNWYSTTIVVGIPKRIEYTNRWELKSHLDLISHASIVDIATLKEIAPNALQTKTTLSYSSYMDAVKVETKTYYAGYEVNSESYFDKEHPEYTRLKGEYEELMQKYQVDYYPSIEKQRTVEIDSKKFDVSYYTGRPIIYIDSETLYTTEINEVFLDNGEKVWFSLSGSALNERPNISVLKAAVEFNRIQRLRENTKYSYEQIKASTIDKILSHKDKVGETVLTTKNGGYSDEPILVYGCLRLRKNTVSFDIVNDAETADSNTTEALQYLFMQEMAKNYGNNKFSHQPGKKKKILTESEMAMKSDFDSLVREILPNLTIDNIIENLEFLKEYYNDLMNS